MSAEIGFFGVVLYVNSIQKWVFKIKKKKEWNGGSGPEFFDLFFFLLLVGFVVVVVVVFVGSSLMMKKSKKTSLPPLLKRTTSTYSKTGSSPFPGIRLQNVVDPDSCSSEDLRSLTARSSLKPQSSTSTLRSSFGGGPRTPRGTKSSSQGVLAKKESSREKREKKGKKGKGKEKEMVASPLRNGGGLEKEEKEKRESPEDKEIKERYKGLAADDLNGVKNPVRMELLHPKTVSAVAEAGISGEEAEKDPISWMVLTNSLRFLRIDKGLHFSKKPTKPPVINEVDAAELLSGAPPKLKLNEEIGEGAYGKVFKCKCAPISKAPVAVKKMSNKTEKEYQMNLNEIKMLKKYGHPNIVKFHCCYTTKNEYYMVSELMEGGTLEEAMCEYEEKHVAYAARDILKALNHLHQNGIVHRDLKSPNIMLDIEGVVKLIDFGLAASSGEGALIQMCGSPYWLSPEMIRMDPHSCPTDIWSFAISLIEMKNGKPPGKRNALGLMYKVGNMRDNDPPVIPADTNGWSPALIDFVSICLAPDPDKRATAKELLEHAFLKKACKKSEMSEVLTRIFVKDSLQEMGIM